MIKWGIAFLIGMSIVLIFMLKGRLTHEKFRSEIWKTANLNLEENMSLRWDMMNDLRNRYKLIGLTKKEIVDLLGDYGDNTSKEFRYFLGYSKRGINTATLIVTFNEKDIVAEVEVWQG